MVKFTGKNIDTARLALERLQLSGRIYVRVETVKATALALPEMKALRFLRSVYSNFTLGEAQAALALIRGGS